MSSSEAPEDGPKGASSVSQNICMFLVGLGRVIILEGIFNSMSLPFPYLKRTRLLAKKGDANEVIADLICS